MKYIYQHLGLGDHFICNGLIRTLIQPNENYILFAKLHNRASVLSMFSDLPNLFVEIANDDHARSKIDHTSIIIGHIGWPFPGLSFEQSFYAQHNIPFINKWDAFHAPRSSNQILLNTNEPYIFIHDDNRFKIDENRINSTYKAYRPLRETTSCILDYVDLIRGAAEVHCIESSFAFMTDIMGLNDNLYIHRYSRTLQHIEVPQYRTVKVIYI